MGQQIPPHTFSPRRSGFNLRPLPVLSVLTIVALRRISTPLPLPSNFVSLLPVFFHQYYIITFRSYCTDLINLTN